MNKMDKNLRVIIGLGNPGKEYENTYHNAGFVFLDFLAEKLNIEESFKSPQKKGFEFIKNKNFILIKPKIFMNFSGNAAKEAIKYFKAKTSQILIVHDDSDIELGKYKLDFGRSSAGHKGVESIISALKTKSFWRLRLGVRTKKKIKAGGFVLKKITSLNQEKLREVFRTISLLYFNS